MVVRSIIKKGVFLFLLVTFLTISNTGNIFSSPVKAATIEVYSEYDYPHPGVFWYQEDGGYFKAETSSGDKTTPNAGTVSNPIPAPEITREEVDITKYSPPNTKFKDNNGNEYEASQVSNIEIDEQSLRFYEDGTSYKGVNLWKSSATEVIIVAETGQGYEEFRYEQYGTGPLGPKYVVGYYTPLELRWKGTVNIEGVDIEITAPKWNACVNEELELSATLTRSDGSTETLGEHPNLKWGFMPSNVNVRYESNKIYVTSSTPGQIYVDAIYTDPDSGNEASSVGYLNFSDSEDCGQEPGDGEPGSGSGGSCSVDININESGEMTSTDDHMMADPNGTITEDRGNSTSRVFDVLDYGIPTSEDLEVYGQSEKYITDYRYANMTGDVTYTINVSKQYVLNWKTRHSYSCGTAEEPDTCYYDVPHSETVPVEMEFTDPYSVSYWQIGHLNVYSFIDAIFENYALPNEEVTVLNPNLATANSDHSSVVDDHVFLKECENIDLGSVTIDGGYTKPSVPDESDLFESSAQIGSRPPDVKNDFVEVDGYTSMKDSVASLTAPTPTDVPLAEQVSVEKSRLYIDDEKVNKWETSSSITARYESIHTVNTGNDREEFTGYSPDKINTVTVHTPVVMYAEASDDKEHDQRTKPPKRSTPANPDKDRHAFILDRPFTVTLPTVGKHLSEPGYGNRDFAKYYRDKQIRFPFDVYTETKQGFFPKDTWISIPIDEESVTFFLPVWVPEGEYTLEYRAIPINAPANHVSNETPKEHHANLNLDQRRADDIMEYHVSFDTLEVDVVGRLYDFRVTDVLDFNWSSVFRTTEGLINHTGNYYWVGDKGIDGDLRGNKSPFVLPIRHGSHPEGYRNVAVKTGYQFKFDFKTKGDMWREKDAIRITPSFYFVDKTGRNRQKVDVYYHNDANYFVKIGSDDDTKYREVKLNEPLRNVPISQVANTADFYYRHPDRYGYKEITKSTFKDTFIRNFEKEYSKEAIPTGPYGWQILNWKLRTFIGPLAKDVPVNAMVPQEDAIASEQAWYGEYSLPADIYIVEEGRDIAAFGLQAKMNKQSPIFLKDGYLIVNFDIESIQDGNVAEPHLQYIHGELSNQWKREGFKYSFEDPYGYTFPVIDGDVIFYHGDQSSSDDFGSNVTH